MTWLHANSKLARPWIEHPVSLKGVWTGCRAVVCWRQDGAQYMSQEQTLTERGIGEEGRGRGGDISLICDKSVITKNLAFFYLLV